MGCSAYIGLLLIGIFHSWFVAFVMWLILEGIAEMIKNEDDDDEDNETKGKS